MLRNRALIVSALPVEAKAVLSFFDDVHVQSAPSGVSYLTGNRKIFSDKLGEKIRENGRSTLRRRPEQGIWRSRGRCAR
jgi:hypothetical protein